MIRTLTTVAASLVAVLATAHPATAASHSQAATRKANDIPAAIVYVHGTAEWVDDDVRCFAGDARRKVRVQGRTVRKGWTVAYCTDGYVAMSTPRHSPRIIHPGR